MNNDANDYGQTDSMNAAEFAMPYDPMGDDLGERIPGPRTRHLSPPMSHGIRGPRTKSLRRPLATLIAFGREVAPLTNLADDTLADDGFMPGMGDVNDNGMIPGMGDVNDNGMIPGMGDASFLPGMGDNDFLPGMGDDPTVSAARRTPRAHHQIRGAMRQRGSGINITPPLGKNQTPPMYAKSPRWNSQNITPAMSRKMGIPITSRLPVAAGSMLPGLMGLEPEPTYALGVLADEEYLYAQVDGGVGEDALSAFDLSSMSTPMKAAIGIGAGLLVLMLLKKR